MTKIYKDCNTCGECVWFSFLIAHNVGICDGTRSDHFGHVITPDHPSCEVIMERV